MTEKTEKVKEFHHQSDIKEDLLGVYVPPLLLKRERTLDRVIEDVLEVQQRSQE